MTCTWLARNRFLYFHGLSFLRYSLLDIRITLSLSQLAPDEENFVFSQFFLAFVSPVTLTEPQKMQNNIQGRKRCFNKKSAWMFSNPIQLLPDRWSALYTGPISSWRNYIDHEDVLHYNKVTTGALCKVELLLTLIISESNQIQLISTGPEWLIIIAKLPTNWDTLVIFLHSVYPLRTCV